MKAKLRIREWPAGSEEADCFQSLRIVILRAVGAIHEGQLIAIEVINGSPALGWMSDGRWDRKLPAAKSGFVFGPSSVKDLISITGLWPSEDTAEAIMVNPADEGMFIWLLTRPDDVMLLCEGRRFDGEERRRAFDRFLERRRRNSGSLLDLRRLHRKAWRGIKAVFTAFR